MNKIISWLNGKTIAFVGTSKNAGKTTTLNYILRRSFPSYKKIAVTSIGRDGEETDAVTGLQKPHVYVKEGTIVATAADLLFSCDVSKKLLVNTNCSTPLGDVYIFECMTGGEVQIAGPSTVHQMLEVKNQIFQLGADCMFIDGAVERKSFGNPSLSDGVILCVSGNSGNTLKEIVEEVASLVELLNLPIALDCENDSFRIHGALTDSLVAEMIQDNKIGRYSSIVLDDPSKILCSRITFSSLRKLYNTIQVFKKPKLLAISVNPTSVYGRRFDSTEFVQMIRRFVDVPVLDVMNSGANPA